MGMWPPGLQLLPMRLDSRCRVPLQRQRSLRDPPEGLPN
jgi:hypothetical protein